MMRSRSALRQLARRIQPLYWLAGWVRLRRFRALLAAENGRYASRPQSALPPPLLRYRVHGALDEASYAEAGRIIAYRIVDTLRSHGLDEGNPAILDFACGPGRVAVQVKALVPSCRLHGSDIDADAIAWAQGHLRDVGTFAVNAPSPPTSYTDGIFDAAYTVSLFTHLDERAQLAWLAELARIVRPGGLLVATLHGALARASCSREELEELRDRGFVYRIDRKGRLKLDGLPDDYQTAFHSREYVERVWSRWLEVSEYLEGGLHGHQDLVVLKRPR